MAMHVSVNTNYIGNLQRIVSIYNLRRNVRPTANDERFRKLWMELME